MKTILLLQLILTLRCIFVHSRSESGPVGPVILYEIKYCDPDVNLIDYKFKLNVEPDGSNSLDFSFSVPEDYGEEVICTVVADKYVNNGWIKDVYNFDTSLVKFLNDNMKKVLKNFMNGVSPKIKNSTYISKGDYVLKRYQEDWRNLEMEQILYGRFMITLSLTRNDEELACIMAEVETKEP